MQNKDNYRENVQNISIQRMQEDFLINSYNPYVCDMRFPENTTTQKQLTEKKPILYNNNINNDTNVIMTTIPSDTRRNRHIVPETKRVGNSKTIGGRR